MKQHVRNVKSNPDQNHEKQGTGFSPRRLIPIGDSGPHGKSKSDENGKQTDKKGWKIWADRRDQRTNTHSHDGDVRFGSGENRRFFKSESSPDFCRIIVANAAKYGQQDVDANQDDDAKCVALEKCPSIMRVDGDAFSPRLNIFFIGRGNLDQHPDTQGKWQPE